MIMGGDSYSKGREFESRHHILDGPFSHYFVVKRLQCLFEKTKINEKEVGVGTFKKLICKLFCFMFGLIRKTIRVKWPSA